MNINQSEMPQTPETDLSPAMKPHVNRMVGTSPEKDFLSIKS